MHDTVFWIFFFGAPLMLLLVSLFVFRPSARGRYHDAKYVIFSDRDSQHSQVAASADHDSHHSARAWKRN